MAVAIWLYYVTKFFELLDTVFLMLRKKDNQLSFLHVYHHSTMFVFSWTCAKFVPSGSAFLPILINSAVHVFMYVYYLLAAAQCANVFKYKIYVTIIQLVKTLLIKTNFYFIKVELLINVVTNLFKFCF